jgi:hypothetical protein
VQEATESCRSSKRAPRPVHALWLGNKAGECAISVNWSIETADDVVGVSDELDDEDENRNIFSSKTTSREINTRLEGI